MWQVLMFRRSLLFIYFAGTENENFEKKNLLKGTGMVSVEIVVNSNFVTLIWILT